MKRFFLQFHKKFIKHAEECNYPYVGYGIFQVISNPIFYIIWIYFDHQTYENLFVRLGISLICLPLVLEKFWPKKWRIFLPLYWYTAMLYTLPFFFTFMLFKNDFSYGWSLNALTGIVLAILLLDLVSLLILLPLGIMAGILFYYFTSIPTHSLPQANYTTIIITYLSVVIFGALFARRKENIQQEKLQAMKLIGASVAHELRTPLQSLSFGVDGLRQFFPKLLNGYKKAEQADLLKEDEKMKNSTFSLLLGTGDRMEREIKLSAMVIDLLLTNIKTNIDTKTSNESFLITTCVDQALESYPFKTGERELIEWVPNTDFEVQGKNLSIMLILINLIKNSLYYIAKANKGKISIWIENERNKHHFLYFKDTATGIPEKILPHIFNRFYSKREHGAGIGLSYCKMAMESLGGKILCSSVENEYTLFKLEFPVDN
jgi:signal transduction histidine kinase